MFIFKSFNFTLIRGGKHPPDNDKRAQKYLLLLLIFVR